MTGEKLYGVVVEDLGDRLVVTLGTRLGRPHAAGRPAGAPPDHGCTESTAGRAPSDRNLSQAILFETAEKRERMDVFLHRSDVR